MRANISLDEETIEAARDFPRRMSLSRLARHLVRAVTYDDKKWREYLKTDDCKAAREFLRPIRERLG